MVGLQSGKHEEVGTSTIQLTFSDSLLHQPTAWYLTPARPALTPAMTPAMTPWMTPAMTPAMTLTPARPIPREGFHEIFSDWLRQIGSSVFKAGLPAPR